MKKTFGTLLVLSLTCTGLFTSCTSNADAMPNPAPTTQSATTAPMATTSPNATMDVMPSPTASAEPATVGAASTVADAQRLSDRVEDEVEKLSEVDEADAVVIGNIALVGISYDGQYQGGMTDRLKAMVVDRVEMTDKTITAVHVTDDQTLRKSIAALNDMMDDANASFEMLQTKALDIAAQLTGSGLTQPESTSGNQNKSTT
ncbi:MAG: hypothetical protein E7323_09175 [Clostridiales bacterium]|nr:hypothetical protein [Clostridiales bacterium]